jgi:uncharacterized membrane protein
MIQRNRTADILKGFAVIFMIQVHLIELFAQQQIYDSIWGKISLFLGGPPAAPIFMAVMGYFLSQSKKNFIAEIKRGFKLIIWGFALNIGLNLNLFYHIFTGKYQISPFEYLFGVDILFLAGLSVMIIALIKYLFKQRIWIWIGLLLIVVFIPTIASPPTLEGNLSFLTAYFYSDVWWSYFPIIPWLSYVLIGYVFKLVESKIHKTLINFKWYIFAGISVILFFTFNFGFNISSNLEEYYHHNIFFFAFTATFMIFFLIIANSITMNFNNYLTKYIEWLGRKVTTVYVFQWLIIGNISTLIYKTQNHWQIILWFAAILIIVSILVFCWSKLKERNKPIII